MTVVQTRNGPFAVTVEGEGPAVLLLHGWPETALSWRHQVAALAAAGYRAIAPNQRGYDGSFAPDDARQYTLFHLAGDAIAILDALGETGAVAVGHDMGALVAWHLALMRPDRIEAVAAMSVPYVPRGSQSLTRKLRDVGADDYYILYFQEPGVAERELERDVRRTMADVLYSCSGSLPTGEVWAATVPKGGGLLDTAHHAPDPFPSWLPARDLDATVAAFERSGFRGPLNWYRNFERNWELGAAHHGAKIRQPALFVAGSRDPVIAAMGNAVKALPAALADPRGIHLIDGAGHWIQQEAPDKINALLLDFLADR